MPVSRNAHHTQLYDTPCVRTKSVTRFGVSVLNVVATIDDADEPPRRRLPRREELGRAPTARVARSKTAGT